MWRRTGPRATSANPSSSEVGMKSRIAAVAAFAFVFGLPVPASAADDKASKKAVKKGGPEALFKMLDANGDGKLTLEELKAAPKLPAKGKEAKKGGVEAVFKKLDGNGDGKLT